MNFINTVFIEYAKYCQKLLGRLFCQYICQKNWLALAVEKQEPVYS